MKLNELTDKLQGLCHEGYANSDVGIIILDAAYNIKNVKHFQIPVDDIHFKDVFLIQTEGCMDKEEKK